MQALLNELATIVGKDNVLIDHASRVTCSRNANFGPRREDQLPLACVRPRQSTQVGQILRLCSQKGQPVLFRGGATDPVAREDAPRPELIIITTALNRIYEINAIDQTIHLQPGVLCSDARKACAQKGLFLPALPLSEAMATIGGALATNAAGPTASRYGFLGARLISIDLWLANGEKITCFSANDLPGQLGADLPLAALIPGSRGSLGFLGNAKLRLMPLPKIREQFLFSGTLEQLAGGAMRLAALQPAQLYFLDAISAEVLGFQSPLLYVELHESAGDVPLIAREEGLASLNATVFLSLLPGIAPALFAQFGSFSQETCSFPASRLDKFIAGIQNIAANHQIKLAFSGNAALASFQILIFGKGSAALGDLFTLELMLNDELRSDTDAQLTKAQWLERHVGPSRELGSRIRSIVDPMGILPGATRP